MSARFYSVNFNDLLRSHRCNLLAPASMSYIADAIGASRTLFLSMNKTWVHRQGDFFVESPINFLAAIIWWLRKYKDGIYCTLPHAIEMAQTSYDKLFTILSVDVDIATLINPFAEAYRNKTMEMLDSQISSARIPLGRLASPELYWILTGKDLTLDINNSDAPAILCLGADPQRQEALAPVLSLYIDRLNRLINQKDRHPCAMICDEFATIQATAVLTTIATARSNDIVPVIAVQDLSQLRTQYSREEADLILNITGNLVCGQVGGDTARWVSERFPSTMQDRISISTNSNDPSISHSRHLDKTVTPSTIATLSSREFVGIVADDPSQKLELKAFHATVTNDHQTLEKEKLNSSDLPLIHEIDSDTIQRNYYWIKNEVHESVSTEITRIMADRGLQKYIIQ